MNEKTHALNENEVTVLEGIVSGKSWNFYENKDSIMPPTAETMADSVVKIDKYSTDCFPFAKMIKLNIIDTDLFLDLGVAKKLLAENQ